MLYIISRFKNQGGAAIASNRLFSVFKKHKYNVKYVFLEDDNILKKILFKIIFELEYRLSLFVNDKNLRSINIISLLNISKFDHENSIINIHWFHFNLLSLKSIKSIKSPLILTLHDSWLLNKNNSHYNIKYEGGNYILKKYYSIIDNSTRKRKEKIKNITKIIVPSNWLYQKAINSKLFDNNKVILIPNALDTSRYSPLNRKSKKDSVIIYFKNENDYFKGGDLVLKFLKRLSKNILEKDIKIKLVGNKQKISIDNLNIKNLGFLGENDLLHEYQNSSICLNFSRSENLSQFLTEACSCGLPCLGFDIGGNSDIIHDHKNGYLIPNYDIDLYVDKFISLISNKNLLNEFSKYSRNLAISEWDENKVFKKYLNVLNEIS